MTLLVMEVFSCAGGMAEGFRRTGLPVSIAFDWDADHCDSYVRNLGLRPVQMDVKDLVYMARKGWVSGGPIDLLVADPPCTPWSRAGKRQGLADDRDLLLETVELVELLRPRTALIANVPGLDDSPNLTVVQRTVGSLSRHYCIDFARLDAARYGVPQHRVRPFWFLHSRETDHIRWPARTHGDPEECRTIPIHGCGLKPWVTCRDALSHLHEKDLGKAIRLRWRAGSAGPNHRPSKAGAPSRTLTRNTHSDGALLVNDKHPVNRADEPSMVVTAKGDGRGAQGACVMEWPWDSPATVVAVDDRIAPPGHREGSRLSSPNAIKLSEKAAAILQGFPSDWVFAGKTKRKRWEAIGMACPPPLAEAVARSIRKQLEKSADSRTSQRARKAGAS